MQCTKKLMANCPGLVDFVVGLVDFILYLPGGQVKVLGVFLFFFFFFEKINLIHCTFDYFFRLVKITSRLVYPAGYS